jgi:hypothetical protein
MELHQLVEFRGRILDVDSSDDRACRKEQTKGQQRCDYSPFHLPVDDPVSCFTSAHTSDIPLLRTEHLPVFVSQGSAAPVRRLPSSFGWKQCGI